MSNHHKQKSINLHHTQVNNKKLRQMKEQYERKHMKQERKREMKAIGIAWEVFKAVYLVCYLLIMVSGLIYVLDVLYGN